MNKMAAERNLSFFCLKSEQDVERSEVKDYQKMGINTKQSLLYLSFVSSSSPTLLIKSKLPAEAHQLGGNEKKRKKTKKKKQLYIRIISSYLKDLNIKAANETKLNEILSD